MHTIQNEVTDGAIETSKALTADMVVIAGPSADVLLDAEEWRAMEEQATRTSWGQKYQGPARSSVKMCNCKREGGDIHKRVKGCPPVCYRPDLPTMGYLGEGRSAMAFIRNFKL